MNIPDPAVYATIPIMGTCFVWIATQFVQSVSKHSGTVAGDPAPEGITVRDFHLIGELIEKGLAKHEVNFRDRVIDPMRETLRRELRHDIRSELTRAIGPLDERIVDLERAGRKPAYP